MKDMQKNCDTIIKIVLGSILFIFPFSYEEISTEWTVLFSVSMAGCLFLLSGKIKSVNPKILGVAFSILLMLIFDFTEKVSFVHQFNIPVRLTRHIPLSTVLLAIGVLALLIKTLVTGKIKMINHPFVRNFLSACAFLIVLMALFYPFLYRHYQMHPEPDIRLLNKMIKYLMILLLVMDDLSDEKNFRRMSLGFIFSISLTVILSVVL